MGYTLTAKQKADVIRTIQDAIDYVGQANYTERQSGASLAVERAFAHKRYCDPDKCTNELIEYQQKHYTEPSAK